MTATTINSTGKSSALDPRTIAMIVGAICFLLLVIWFMLRFQARQQQLQELGTQIETSTTQLNDLQSKSSQLPALRKDIFDLQTKQKVFETALPNTAQIGQMLSALRNNVAASGGTITSITSTDGSLQSALPSGVKAIDLSLNMSGRFNSVFQTLQSTETMGRFTKIKDVTITLPAPNDADPDLTGVINMTTYTFDPSAAQPAAATGTPATPAAPPAAAAPGGRS